jgi:hypothetical protein
MTAPLTAQLSLTIVVVFFLSFMKLDYKLTSFVLAALLTMPVVTTLSLDEPGNLENILLRPVQYFFVVEAALACLLLPAIVFPVHTASSSFRRKMKKTIGDIRRFVGRLGSVVAASG